MAFGLNTHPVLRRENIRIAQTHFVCLIYCYISLSSSFTNSVSYPQVTRFVARYHRNQEMSDISMNEETLTVGKSLVLDK